MANPRNHCNCFKSTGTSQFSTALTFSASISTCPGEIINPTNPTVAWWNSYFLAIPNNWYWSNHCFPCGRHKVFVVVLKGHFPFVPFTDPNKVILISHKEKSSTDSRMGRTADPCRQRTLDVCIYHLPRRIAERVLMTFGWCRPGKSSMAHSYDWCGGRGWLWTYQKFLSFLGKNQEPWTGLPTQRHQVSWWEWTEEVDTVTDISDSTPWPDGHWDLACPWYGL